MKFKKTIEFERRGKINLRTKDEKQTFFNNCNQHFILESIQYSFFLCFYTIKSPPLDSYKQTYSIGQGPQIKSTT